MSALNSHFSRRVSSIAATQDPQACGLQDREDFCYSRNPATITMAVGMTYDELRQRISIDTNICFGKPCIRGHRIWVSLVLDFLASGESIEDILRDYPQIEEADIMACIAYGAEMSRERFVDIPTETTP